MKLQLFFLCLFQLFASLLLSIYQRLRFIITSPKLGSVPRMRQISPDILLDIGDFLSPKQRQQLLLVNRQFLITIERGMQKFWFTEEYCLSTGELMIDKRRVLTYCTNLDQLLGAENLFLRVRLRLLENVGAGELGRGDALILALEYKSLINSVEDKEEILATYAKIARRCHSNDFLTILWKYFKKQIDTWKGMIGVASYQCKNDDPPLQQYERRILINSGNLMRGRTHRLQIMENTLCLKCRLKKEDQRWRIGNNGDPRNDYFVGIILGTDRKNSATKFLDSFTLDDVFTYEIVRSAAAVCWPRAFPIKRPMPVRNFALQSWNGYGGEKFYRDKKFVRPICHLDIDGENVTFKMHCHEILFLTEKIIIYKDELGLHICVDPILGGLEYYWHRLIRIPKEIDELYSLNWSSWHLNRWEEYFIAKGKLKKKLAIR